jgi:ketosteroid isomerase-like protein
MAGAGTFPGSGGGSALVEQLREAWDNHAMEPISFTDAGDRVLVRLLWRGAGQGPESNMEFTVIYMLRNGMIVYQEHSWDHAQALEAVGLSEQDAHADP